MARKTIQKKFTETQVRGYTLRDGAPVETVYIIPRAVGLVNAQAIIRRTDASFMAVSADAVETLYKMDFDTFKKYATVVDATDADTDEEEEN